MGLEMVKTTTTEVREQIELSGSAAKHLNALYQKIWCEACYDPDTDDTKKFAATLLPSIQALNAELKFKT